MVKRNTDREVYRVLWGRRPCRWSRCVDVHHHPTGPEEFGLGRVTIKGQRLALGDVDLDFGVHDAVKLHREAIAGLKSRVCKFNGGAFFFPSMEQEIEVLLEASQVKCMPAFYAQGNCCCRVYHEVPIGTRPQYCRDKSKQKSPRFAWLRAPLLS